MQEIERQTGKRSLSNRFTFSMTEAQVTTILHTAGLRKIFVCFRRSGVCAPG